MKPEMFFETFDHFADAPNAVAALRKIILHLAVHGSLVEQSDEDEPAREMLKRLIDRQPSLLESEELPQSWASVALGDLIALQKGKKPSSLNTEGIGLPYLDIAALERGDFRQFTDDERCPRSAPGDLVIVCDGSRSGLVLDGTAGVLGSTVSKVGYEGFVRDYLKLFLRSLYDDLNGAKKGAAIPHLDIPRLLAIPAPIPPLAEQKRIVAKVDELTALCDRLEAQQRERGTRHAALARASLSRFADAPNPANLPFLFHPSYAIPPVDLRKSILTLAVQGNLIPQDPNDERAEDSLARNDEGRREIARSDHRAVEEYQPLLSADDRWDIPDTWAWRGLADLVLFVDYRGKTPTKQASGVRLLTAKNVRKGQINLSPEEFLSESDYHAWMTRGFPKPGDVLFTTEAPLGNAAVVEMTERFALAQRVICFQSYGALDPAFLVLQILSDQFQFILEKNGTGVTAKGIKASKLKQLPIAVPPVAEQRRIVAKVEQLMALVDALETQVAASSTKGADLMEAVVAELTVGV